MMNNDKEEEIKLNVKFCKPEDVDRKFTKIIMFKIGFNCRLHFMKMIGQKHELMNFVQVWINEDEDFG